MSCLEGEVDVIAKPELQLLLPPAAQRSEILTTTIHFLPLEDKTINQPALPSESRTYVF